VPLRELRLKYDVLRPSLPLTMAMRRPIRGVALPMTYGTSAKLCSRYTVHLHSKVVVSLELQGPITRLRSEMIDFGYSV
jgi:hypothetical protein